MTDLVRITLDVRPADPATVSDEELRSMGAFVYEVAVEQAERLAAGITEGPTDEQLARFDGLPR